MQNYECELNIQQNDYPESMNTFEQRFSIFSEIQHVEDTPQWFTASVLLCTLMKYVWPQSDPTVRARLVHIMFLFSCDSRGGFVEVAVHQYDEKQTAMLSLQALTSIQSTTA